MEPAPAARRASPRTSTASPRTTTSTSRCSASSLLERARPRLHRRSTSRSSGSTTCRPGGSSRPSASRCATCSRRSCRRRPRRGATRSASGSARGCASTSYGWARARRPGARRAHGVGGRAPQPHGERRLRGDVDGGRARGVALGETIAAECADVGARRSSRRAAGSPRRCASRASSTVEWEVVVDAALRALRRLPLGARDQQHRARRRGALRVRRLLGRDLRRRPGRAGTPTRTARRSARSSARCGPIEARWSAPLHGRFASSLPGFDGDRRSDELAGAHARASLVERSTRSSRGRSTVPTPCRSTAQLDELDGARSSPRPTIPPTGPHGATRSRAGATRRARRLRRQRLRAARRGRRAASPSRSSGSGTSGSTTTTAQRFTPERLLAEARARVRRLRRRRPLARVSGDRDRRAQPVRLVPRRARPARARARPSSARGVRVFLDYNPWDVGTRREPVDDATAVARARARARRRRGLPRHDEGGAARAARGASGRGVAFEGESTLPLARIARPPPLVGAVVRRHRACPA